MCRPLCLCSMLNDSRAPVQRFFMADTPHSSPPTRIKGAVRRWTTMERPADARTVVCLPRGAPTRRRGASRAVPASAWGLAPAACCCLYGGGVDGCGGSGCGGATVRARRAPWLALSQAASAAGSSRNLFRTIACSRRTALMPRSTVASKDAVAVTGESLLRARPLIASSNASRSAFHASTKCAGIACFWNAPARGTASAANARPAVLSA